ncbi:IclR family transcriptional regulator [Aneurinibacillus tyrosinisolvens]|uniref:IclR family transcriptional regulator n=1 Tax=Aneurinibacillus tyrosinisolvens TaxID=1443435 RepID=UPI00069A360B|nr:IclR family transcriptional regulator [Aneurinibacillus tyrosinisolvens]
MGQELLGVKQQEVLSSVHNAIRILKAFSMEERELGISELSSRLGLAKSTVFRLMKTLNEAHLVEKNIESQKYQLGIAAFELGFMVYHSMELRRVAVPLLDKLMNSVRKVVRLGVYDQGGVVYLYKGSPEVRSVTKSKIGNRVSVYCTAVGKILLAFQSKQEIDRVLAGELTAYTPHTITQPEVIKTRLTQIRKTGVAVTHEELRLGICSVAVPVYNDLGKVIAAISVTGNKSHFYPAQIQYYVKEMNIYSRLITEQLGLNP